MFSAFAKVASVHIYNTVFTCVSQHLCSNGQSLCALFLFDRKLLSITEVIPEQPSAVFILMAIHAQIFPVRTVRGVIQWISVFMVNGQEMPLIIIKFSRTFCTDEAVYSKGKFPVVARCCICLF